MPYYVGIDLGGTNIAAGVVDQNGKIITKSSVPTMASDGVDAIVKNMATVCKTVISDAKLDIDDIESIGIGTPGTLDIKNGIVEYAANLGFKNTPLTKMLSEYFPKKPIYIENDANVAALAESIAGSAKGTNDSIIITLGTGVGGGIIIGGKIYSGFNGRGGEIGHIGIMVDGWQCTCGRKGCWESYASITGLIKLTKIEMKKDKQSVMWRLTNGDIEKVSGRTAFDGMRKGDKTAKFVVDTYLRYVATGIVDVVNMLQPEVLSIGGGISKEGDTLLIPVKEYVEKKMFSRNAKTKTRICIAKLGNDAGIVGAAMLKGI